MRVLPIEMEVVITHQVLEDIGESTTGIHIISSLGLLAYLRFDYRALRHILDAAVV